MQEGLRSSRLPPLKKQPRDEMENVASFSSGPQARGYHQLMQPGASGVRNFFGRLLARRFGFDAPPAHGTAAHGFFYRAKQHHVHHLSVVKPLQQYWNQQGPLFPFFERESHDAREHVDHQKAEKKDNRALEVGQRPELRQVKNMELRQTPQKDRAEEHQIDDRRNERKQKLENENVRECDPTQGPVARTKQSVGVLPERLQSAESPAESLPDERLARFRRLGPRDSFFVVDDAPAQSANRNGEVGVFRYGVRRDASGRLNRLPAPSAKRARYNGDAIQQIKGALFHVLARDVFEGLPARQPTGAIADLHVAGDGANAEIGKVAQELAHCVGLHFRIGVDGDQDFRVCLRHGAIQGGSLAAIRLVKDTHARIWAEMFLEKLCGAVGGTIVHDDDAQVRNLRGERGRDGLDDYVLLVMRGDENSYGWRWV